LESKGVGCYTENPRSNLAHGLILKMGLRRRVRLIPDDVKELSKETRIAFDKFNAACIIPDESVGHDVEPIPMFESVVKIIYITGQTGELERMAQYSKHYISDGGFTHGGSANHHECKGFLAHTEGLQHA
jgi:hypothetical protein